MMSHPDRPADPSPQSNWSWLPNSISLARLCSVPLLLWLAVNHKTSAFAALLILALCSDVLDGWLARRLHAATRLGAVLDSLGDMALTLAILAGIWWLQPQVYQQDGWIIYALLLAWLLAHSASLLRYGRLASYHTWLIRIGIAMFNLFAVILFVFDYYPWLLYLAASLSLLGVVEHFLLLKLLPEWTPDIPGGLFSVVRRRPGTNGSDLPGNEPGPK